MELDWFTDVPRPIDCGVCNQPKLVTKYKIERKRLSNTITALVNSLDATWHYLVFESFYHEITQQQNMSNVSVIGFYRHSAKPNQCCGHQRVLRIDKSFSKPLVHSILTIIDIYAPSFSWDINRYEATLSYCIQPSPPKLQNNVLVAR